MQPSRMKRDFWILKKTKENSEEVINQVKHILHISREVETTDTWKVTCV